MAVVLSSVIFIQSDRERHEIDEEHRYTLIADAFLAGLQFFPTDRQLAKLYENFDVKPVDTRERRLQIVNNSNLLYVKKTAMGRVRIFMENGRKYIYVQNFGYNLMLQDLKPRKYHQEIALLLVGLITTILSFIYISLRRKLIPLRRLHEQVEQFANGDLNIEIEQYANDEIGRIAMSFDKAILSINHLIRSKNLFMRNMMHELKTPITKGRIVAETLENEFDRDILIRAFERMNDIITQLAQVEKLTSSAVELKKESVSLQSMVDEARGLLLTDTHGVKSEFEDFKIFADSSLFTIVLKNLFDNGVKFSPSSEVFIRAAKDEIKICSDGEPLKMALSYYTEPFSQEQKKSDGFGLGLYIVKSILDLHQYQFSYYYKNGQNIFVIGLDT